VPEQISSSTSTRGTRDERSKELLTKLEEGIKTLTTSEGYRDWLRVQSLFHNYSWGNSLIVAGEQAYRGLEPERVAGFRAWHEIFQRTVKKGSKAIWILGPVTHKVITKDEETGEEQVAYPLVGWTSVPVFSLSDTEGKPLPDSPCRRLVGEGNSAAQSAVVALIEQEGYSFAISPAFALGGANGLTTKETKSVLVRDDLSSLQTLKTSLHELAHIRLRHLDQVGTSEGICRGEAELQAESVAFCTLSALSLESGDYSFGYVVHWQGGGDEAVKGVKANAQKIASVSDGIITQLEAAGEVQLIDALQASWEAASDQEQALADHYISGQLQAREKAGKEVTGLDRALLRDQALARVREAHQVEREDEKAIREMEEISRECSQDRQLVLAR
jgi:hypothetical protein